MKKELLIFLACLLTLALQAQHTLSGVVTDEDKQPLIGVNIAEIGTLNGTVTDYEGKYTLTVKTSTAALYFSYTGFITQEVKLTGQTELDITMAEGVDLGEIQVVGSRSYRRSSTDTPVAIDVIDISEVTANNGQVEINQILQYAAPSFNAGKQSGSDGADHIDPATLRGLGPDQTLVLINGKRRHQSSLVNIFGTRGRGNSGTDLNAIPTSAIKRIEVLRDGASAQYGSDAIAGVINIVLNDKVGELNGSVTYGAYNTSAEGDFPAGTPNTDGNRLDTDKDGNQIGDDKSLDGGSVKLAANYGFGIGKGGFANITTEYVSKNKTLRPSATFRRGFGEAAIDGFGIFVNAGVPIADKTEFYLFGGSNYRDTDAFAFTRNNPTARNVISIYPDGFTPRITSIINDNSVSAGIRTSTKDDWNIDINNTYGVNDFHYYIKGTLNASLEEASPTDFDAGGHRLSQNTSSLGFTKYFETFLNGTNVAFGLEYRKENFEIFSGEAGSYGTFDENGLLITRGDQNAPIDPETGDPRPGGSQGFPGYSPANEVDRSRSNIALYADAEFELSDPFLVSLAGRYESYSDFGNTLNYKLAARYEISQDFALRGSVSSGFRAPSLVQIFYNLKFTNFIGGVPVESLLAPNNSPVTAGFGIDKLKEEEATNASLGFVLNAGDFTATVDGYYIKIDDRIVLTGNFDASALNIGVSDAQFFANGLDTETTGLDVVLSWRRYIGDNKITAALMGNINSMKVKNVKSGNLDKGTFFGPRDEYFLLASAPNNKFRLNLGYEAPNWNVNLSVTRFSEVELLGFEVFEFEDPFATETINAARDTYEAKIITDVSVGVKLSDQFKLTVGANNLLNVYPTQQDSDWTEGGGYWDTVQMGFSGAYYFARLGFQF
ncbi:MAG: TonB-dependent receptor [Saprospiraceae bacterium]|nr:MAG: TonB-dependent receptor [Saprospiraceae bacterium]